MNRTQFVHSSNSSSVEPNWRDVTCEGQMMPASFSGDVEVSVITGDKASQLPLVSPDVKRIGPKEDGQVTVWIRVAAGFSHQWGMRLMFNSTGRHAVQVC